MMDTPFRVERDLIITNGNHFVATTEYVVKQTGVGTICRCNDPVYAYKIVDALNLTSEVRTSGGSRGP